MRKYSYEVIKQMTELAMRHPKAGDSFHELFTFVVHILKVEKGKIYTQEGNANDMKNKVYKSANTFRKKFAYKNIKGYWIDYVYD